MALSAVRAAAATGRRARTASHTPADQALARHGVSASVWRSASGPDEAPYFTCSASRPANVSRRRCTTVRSWFVPAAPARLVEPPDEVDVLPRPQRRVETADVVERLDAHEQRRTRHVADAGAGADARRLVAEVERRAGIADHPRGDEPDAWIVEVAEHGSPPVGRGGIAVVTTECGARRRRRRGTARSMW